MEFEYTVTTKYLKYGTFDRDSALRVKRKYPNATLTVLLRGGKHDEFRCSRCRNEYEKRMREKRIRTYRGAEDAVLTGRDIIFR